MSLEFSLERYREILEIGLEKGYRFVGYPEMENIPADQKAIVLRHDIDYTPEWSMNFAEIEKSLGIQSTYFFQVCAKPYNLRETHNVHVVRQLKKMGHEIGLHFDVTWAGDPAWEELPRLCRDDKVLFHQMTGVEPCEMISFHNPHRYLEQILNKNVEGIRHTYERELFSDIKYLSDSQGWYEGCPSEILRQEKYSRIQLLMHPYIWPAQATGDFIRNVAVMLKDRGAELTEYILKYHPLCKKYEQELRAALIAQATAQ